MKTLVVGDLHGQYEIAEAALNTGYFVVFIGDYVDSYTRPVHDQIHTLRTVLRAVEDGQAIALRGNHELSYFEEGMRASGWKFTTDSHLFPLRQDFYELTKPYVWHEGFLISHAGVSQNLLDSLDCTLEEYLEEGNFNQIGYARGGYNQWGGLFWCDWRYEFAPIPGVSQIVGHTRGEVIREEENNWCIDVLEDHDPQGLLIENGVAELYNFGGENG